MKLVQKIGQTITFSDGTKFIVDSLLSVEADWKFPFRLSATRPIYSSCLRSLLLPLIQVLPSDRYDILLTQKTNGDQMKALVSALLVVLCWVPLGCGGGSTGNTGVNGTASLSGNWQLTSNSTVFSGTTGNISASLATSGTAVIGIAHISSPCYQYFTDVPLSGQIQGNGTFTISSGSVNSQILTITGTSLGSSISSGAYSIAGGCGAGDKGTVSGYTLAALTGTYSGTISTGLGSSVQVVAQLTQSTTANSVSGYYAATGSATFSGSPCYTQGTIASSSLGVLGNEFGINFTTPGSSPSTVSMAGIFDAAAKTITVQSYYGGVCGGSGTGTLTAQ
jgi:hypothetical protein